MQVTNNNNVEGYVNIFVYGHCLTKIFCTTGDDKITSLISQKLLEILCQLKFPCNACLFTNIFTLKIDVISVQIKCFKVFLPIERVWTIQLPSDDGYFPPRLRSPTLVH